MLGIVTFAKIKNNNQNSSNSNGNQVDNDSINDKN